MTKKNQVAVLVGSLRQASFSRAIADAAAQVAPASLQLAVAEIGQAPFYNEDLESTPPAAWQALRQQVQRSDAVLFITPEYNRSVPAVLKNAVDVLSRPWGQGVLRGKPAAVISCSPGALGGFGANHHLRQALVGVDAVTMGGPESYIGGVDSLFDVHGHLANEATRQFLHSFLQSFERWIDAHASR